VVKPGASGADEHARNLNPPHFHLLMRPFTWFSPPVAFGLWLALGIAALAASLSLTYRTLGLRLSPAGAALAVVAILAAAPTIAVLLTGQFAWMLALAVTWAWMRARSARWIAAAAALGVAASLKPFLGLFLPYLLLHRRWAAAAAFTGTAAGSYVAGVAAFGTAAAAGHVASFGSISWASNVLNGSAYGVLQRAAHGAAGKWDVVPVAAATHLPIALVWVALSMVILAVTFRAVRPLRVGAGVDRDFLLLIAAGLLVSPLGWSYYFWLLVAPLVAMASRYRWWRLDSPSAALACVALAGCLWPPEMLDLGQPAGWATISIGSIYFWALAAIWGAAAAAGFSGTRGSSAHGSSIATSSRPPSRDERGAQHGSEQRYLHAASVGAVPSSIRIVGGCAASWTITART
jgi:hypothetical protein